MTALDHNGPVRAPYVEFKREWLDRSVFQRFKEVSSAHADRLALKDNRHAFDYRQAYHRCLHLASAIQKMNPGKEPVGIALPNNAYFPLSMLAVLANGCPYVPLDLDLPKSRNERIIRHSGAKAIISSSEYSDLNFDVPVIDIDRLDFDSLVDFTDKSDPSDIAYIIYTSGSTGTPKGVYQNQRNLLHDVMQYTNSIHLSYADRSSLLYSPSVNGAIRDIYGTLLNGASLVIRRMTGDGLLGLAEFIEKEEVTIYHSIPNIFRTFLGVNAKAPRMDSVRIVYLAGDRIFKSDVSLFKRHFPEQAMLYVGIGSTEAATIYRQWFISKGTNIEDELIPLGYAIPERDMVIVDEEGRPVPDGVKGEITVRSRFVSLGYWKDPELTEGSFKVYPYGSGERTFSTGDLGRVNAEGMLEFIGRKDAQVKINGHRVEIAEVEAALMECPGVERCAVDVEVSAEGAFLVALIVSRFNADVGRIRDSLREGLPPYMIPRHIIPVDEIPVLHNFKNDKVAVRDRIRSFLSSKEWQGDKGGDGVGIDPLWDAIRMSWTKFLDGTSFDEGLSWRKSGGDSISSLHFIVQLEASLQVKFSDGLLAGDFTPNEVYDQIVRQGIGKTSNHKRKIYFFPPPEGLSVRGREFLKELSALEDVVVLSYPNLRGISSKDINPGYLNEHLMAQIPDYNRPDVGYIGNCRGASVMANLIDAHPLTSYSFVGLIDAARHLKRSNLRERVKAIARYFGVDVMPPEELFLLLFMRYPAVRSLLRIYHRGNFPDFHRSTMLKVLFLKMRSIEFPKDLELFVFATEGTVFEEFKEFQEVPGTAMRVVPLAGGHREVFNEGNRRRMVEFIRGRV